MVLLGASELERTLKEIAQYEVGSVSRAACSGMAAPLKKGIRKAIDAQSAPHSVKKALKKSIGSKVKKVGGEYGLRVGVGVGKKRGRTAQGAAVGRKAGVGITAGTEHWAIFGTGEYSTKTGQARSKKSTGASTGSSRPHFEGIIEKGVLAATPQAVAAAAVKAKIALRKAATKRRRSYSVPGGGG